MINEAKANEEEDKKIAERISAKNSFDSYLYQIKNQIDDPDKLANKLSDDEKETIKEALKEAEEWASSNDSAEKEQYEEQQKKLEEVANPIISKHAGGQAPPPGGEGDFENPDDL
jgi:heat shock protein 5